MRLGDHAPRARRRAKSVDHLRPVDERRQPLLQEQPVIRVLPAEHEDRRGDADVSQRQPFLDQRDSEPFRAGLEERLRRNCGAMPVRVRLHHRHHTAAGRRAACFAQVVRQRVAVDARLGRADAQIEGTAGGIAQGHGSGFGHVRASSRTVPQDQWTTSNSLVGFPAARG